MIRRMLIVLLKSLIVINHQQDSVISILQAHVSLFIYLVLATCSEDKRLGFIDASGKIAHRIKKAH